MLTFEPVVRLATCEDAVKYLDFLFKLDIESDWMHFGSGERSMDERGMRSRLRKMERQGNAFAVLAFNLAGEVIGYFSVNGGNSSSTRHSGTCAVGVLDVYRHNGLARQLFLTALAQCGKVHVKRLECTVVVYNNKAVDFYKRCGFIEVGRLHDRFQSRMTGEYLDEYILEYDRVRPNYQIDFSR
ncbi:MAG: GNAT family N-acetyltransferase [Magnetococcus sp. YQC-3]